MNKTAEKKPKIRHPEGKIIVFEKWCKRCGICVAFCPTGALANDERGVPYLAAPEKCVLCGQCWLRCPDLAIIEGPKVEIKEEE
ncbi:4Fe-4S binding protein [bacterium]|nr:4Fe-4S binding protein [bacterium]